MELEEAIKLGEELIQVEPGRYKIDPKQCKKMNLMVKTLLAEIAKKKGRRMNSRNSNCPVCQAGKHHTKAETRKYHPLVGHGYTPESGWTSPEAKKAFEENEEERKKKK